MRGGTPVYLVAGFLEGGKTTFINQLLQDEAFLENAKVVIISCEEGFEEYDEALLARTGAQVVPIENKEDFSGAFLKNVEAQYKPDMVVIEYNGTWLLDDIAKVRMPRGWRLGEVVSLIDFGTFQNYLTNMKSMVSDFVVKSDMVVFNRCDAEKKEQKSSFRRAIRALNPRCDIIFDNKDGSVDDGRTEEDLPYDLKADVIEVTDDDFGTFYIDAMENPNRYDGKTLKLRGMAFDMGGGSMAFGRMAMTCCADDIRAIGFNVMCSGSRPTPQQWIEAVVSAKADYSPVHGRDAIVLEMKKFKSAKKPSDDLVYFN